MLYLDYDTRNSPQGSSISFEKGYGLSKGGWFHKKRGWIQDNYIGLDSYITGYVGVCKWFEFSLLHTNRHV